MTDAAERIRGRDLTSIEFVEDYLQLRFDAVCLTINAPVSAVVSGGVYGTGSAGFSDLLRNQIGKSVKSAATVAGERIVLEFKDGSRIEVSLKDEAGVSGGGDTARRKRRGCRLVGRVAPR